MREFVLYALTGKLLLFLLKKFTPFRIIISKSELLQELYGCNLCLGFWVYLALSLVSKDINAEHIKNKYVGKFVVASFTTFIMHLISIGWEESFETVYIDNAYNSGQSS